MSDKSLVRLVTELEEGRVHRGTIHSTAMEYCRKYLACPQALYMKFDESNDVREEYAYVQARRYLESFYRREIR